MLVLVLVLVALYRRRGCYNRRQADEPVALPGDDRAHVLHAFQRGAAGARVQVNLLTPCSFRALFASSRFLLFEYISMLVQS